MSKELLQIKNLYANAETKEILKGLNLNSKGELINEQNCNNYIKEP